MSSRKLSRKDNKRLRQRFDADDTNVFTGMGIKAPRYLQIQRRPEEEAAPFLYNDTGTKEFLLKCFPRLASKDPDHFHQAAFWYEVIHLYWRLGWTDRRIEEERGPLFFASKVGYTVQQIRRKIKGLRRNGKPYSTRKRGRPRKQATDEVICFDRAEMEKWVEHILGEEIGSPVEIH